MANEHEAPECEAPLPACDEDSRDQIPATSTLYRFCCMVVYVLAMSVYSFQIGSLGPTLPNLAQNVGLEPTDPMFSSIFLVHGVLQVVAGPFSGLAIDLTNSHIVMAVALLIEAACLVLIPLSSTLLALVIRLGLSFLLLTFVRTGIFTLVCRINPRYTSSNLLILAVAFGVTNLTVPKAADWFETHLWFSRLTVFSVWGGLSALVAVGLLLLKVPKLPEDQKKTNTMRDCHETKKREANILMWEGWVVASCAAVQFVAVAVEQVMGNWVYTYAVQHAGLENSQGSTVTSVYWGMFCGFRILVAVMGFWVPITPATGVLMFVPFGIAGAIIPLITPVASMYLLCVTAVLVGIGNSTGFPNSIAMLATYSSPSGFANGVMSAVSGMGNSLVPAVVGLGVTGTPLGWQWLFCVLATLFVLHFPLVWVTVYLGNKLAWLKDEHDRQSAAGVATSDADLERPLIEPDTEE